MDEEHSTYKELNNKLKRLRIEFDSKQNMSHTQRIMHELEINELELAMHKLQSSEIRRQLQDTQNRYAALYAFSPVAYLTFDNQAHIIDLNQAAANMLGLTIEKIKNQAFAHWLDESQCQQFLQHLVKVSFSKDKVVSDQEIKRADGSSLRVRLESIAVRDKEGVADRCHTAIIDISHEQLSRNYLNQDTELEQRVEERTRELTISNQALQEEIDENFIACEKLKQAAKVFDNTEDGIIFMDASLDVINVNRAFCTITGYSADELVAKNPKRLLSSRCDEQYYQQILDALKTGGHWKGEVSYQHKNGDIIPVWENINVVRDDAGIVSHYVAIVTDITPLKETERRLNHLAHHDALTGLPNRLYFNSNLEQSIKRAKRHRRSLALLLLDLDRFKMINDTYGHANGDLLLKVLAERLQDCVRSEDTVARLSGDEFTIILDEISQFEDVAQIAEKILDKISQPVKLDNRQMVIKTSIGISTFPADADDAESLLKAADAAMYRAKDLGRHRYQFYTAELNNRARQHQVLEKQLHQALEKNQFEIYYQPQFNVHDDQVVGLEALLRWHHPDKGLLSANSFIRVAEDTGIIDSIDEWVLNTACQQMTSWQAAGFQPVRVSINMAARTLTRGQIIVDKVRRLLSDCKLSSNYLELEFPERILHKDSENLRTLHALKQLGIKLSIDDFGTGFMPIGSLKNLPFDTVKIDRSFISDIPHNPKDVAITSAIIAMAHNLNVKVTAEGVVTKEQFSFLKLQGCDEMQGFLFSEPVPQHLARHYMHSELIH